MLHYAKRDPQIHALSPSEAQVMIHYMRRQYFQVSSYTSPTLPTSVIKTSDLLLPQLVCLTFYNLVCQKFQIIAICTLACKKQKCNNTLLKHPSHKWLKLQISVYRVTKLVTARTYATNSLALFSCYQVSSWLLKVWNYYRYLSKMLYMLWQS